MLCVNSALIQKLFYAVKRTCDRQRGGEGEEWGRTGEGGWGHFLVTCPLSHIQNKSLVFVQDLLRGKNENMKLTERSMNEGKWTLEEPVKKDGEDIANVVTDLHFVAKQLP